VRPRGTGSGTGRKVVLGLIGAAVAGAGVALASHEELRDQVLAAAKALGEEIAGGDENQR
jgi:hypothetical protein